MWNQQFQAEGKNQAFYFIFSIPSLDPPAFGPPPAAWFTIVLYL